MFQPHVISGSLYDDENFEYVHYVTQAVRALKLYSKDVDYVVADDKVQIVDEFTGRILVGRRYSDGLHQAIEAKEGIKVLAQNKTLATITFQNFFRMYGKLSGMTGTADTEAPEFMRSIICMNRVPFSRFSRLPLIWKSDKPTSPSHSSVMDHTVFPASPSAVTNLTGSSRHER